jgi:hypothetical protein
MRRHSRRAPFRFADSAAGPGRRAKPSAPAGRMKPIEAVTRRTVLRFAADD